jgi:hypothetical protein
MVGTPPCDRSYQKQCREQRSGDVHNLDEGGIALALGTTC